jgi:hypothetical protein
MSDHAERCVFGTLTLPLPDVTMAPMATWKKGLLSCFVFYHLGAVLTWIVPSSELKTTFYQWAQPYMVGLGLWQAWNMFSPDPSNLNMHVHAAIGYADGTTHEYYLPRMDKLDYVSKYQAERFRKYVENVHEDANALYWPNLAQWIALQDQQITHKSPVSIQLIRTWWNVPPPGGDTTVTPLPDWHTFTFFQAKLKNGVIIPLTK